VIVVDANLIIGVVLQTQPRLEAVMARDRSWVAPPLWRSEFCNALAGYIRREELPLDGAIAAFDEAESIVRVVEPDAAEVLRLVTTSPCTAYDLEYVAIAHALGVPLVTLDRQVLASFPDIALTPTNFAPDPPALT
jgi:predicted nucleic acid-binding protein